MKNIFLSLLTISLSIQSVHAQTLDWYRQFSSTGDNEVVSATSDRYGNQIMGGMFTSSINLAMSGQPPISFSSNGGRDILIAKYNTQGTLLWAKQIGGSNINNDILNSIAVNNENRILVSGSFTGLVDFDPGVAVFNLNAMGGSDGFLLELDSNGVFVNAYQFGNSNAFNSGGTTIAFNSNNEIILTGYFGGTMDIDLLNTQFNVVSSSGIDIFIAKFDSMFNLIFAKSFGGQFNDALVKMVVDEFNNTLLGFNFYVNVDVDPSTSVYNLTSNGGLEIAIVKLDQNGNLIWGKSIGGVQDDFLSDLLSYNNDLIITGCFKSIVDFDPNSGVYNITSQGGFDSFLCKYDSSSNLLVGYSFGALDDQLGVTCTNQIIMIYFYLELSKER